MGQVIIFPEMNATLRGEFLTFANLGEWKNYIKTIRGIFKRVQHIASSVNWEFRYAFFNPSLPTEEELKAFRREVESVKEELRFLKLNFKPKNPELLEVLEGRLNQMVEEYTEYPFSDRKHFFRNRLAFIRNSIRGCFAG